MKIIAIIIESKQIASRGSADGLRVRARLRGEARRRPPWAGRRRWSSGVNLRTSLGRNLRTRSCQGQLKLKLKLKKILQLLSAIKWQN
jgi:hypothetical protein